MTSAPIGVVCRKMFGPEGRQHLTLSGLRHLAQYPAYSLLAALARHSVHTDRQLGKAVRFGNAHPHHVNRVAD